MASPTASPRKLQTAEERREDVLASATVHFARRGYYGTPTTDIAKDAGISQAYLFRLFPTKRELFIATFERCIASVAGEMQRVAAPYAGDVDAVLQAMGMRYSELLQDRDQLLLQLQGYAASDDEEVRDAVRRGYGGLVDMVRALSGAPDDRIASFFSTGLMLTVMASMGAHDLDLPWATSLMAGLDHPC